MDSVIESYMARIRELETTLAEVRGENIALHAMLVEFRDELASVEVQLNTMVRDRTYVA